MYSLPLCTCMINFYMQSDFKKINNLCYICISFHCALYMSPLNQAFPSGVIKDEPMTEANKQENKIKNRYNMKPCKYILRTILVKRA